MVLFENKIKNPRIKKIDDYVIWFFTFYNLMLKISIRGRPEMTSLIICDFWPGPPSSLWSILLNRLME